MNEVRFIAASGGLGAGKVDAAALEQAMQHEPHFIASDAGSTDSGPFSLGSGRPNYPREAVKRELALILQAARPARIPVIIGSCGTAGTDDQVNWMLDVAREIALEQQSKFRTAVIYSEQDKNYLRDLWHSGRIRPLDPAPKVDEAVILGSTRIVGMMGVEPLQRALEGGADLILAGRCSDAALYAALPIMRGLPHGLAWHAGKVVECGTLVCETSGRGAILGRVTEDAFYLTPFGKGLRCTPQSVAAHSLYETADPFLQKEASGTMDLTHSTFTAVDDVTVRVAGSKFIAADTYTIKLEGAEMAGFQTIIIGGIRDPFIIAQLDQWLAGVRAKIAASVKDILGDQVSSDQYQITFHIYGRDAVMGELEPKRDATPHEVGIVLEATASTQVLATKIAELSRQPLLHHPIPEWKGAITGFACLHNPACIDRGAVYRFNLHHVAVPHTQEEMFRTQFVELG